MNKKGLLFIFSALLFSCAGSHIDKANKLIQVEVKMTLYVPDSYEYVETKLDSVFSPCDPVLIINKKIELAKNITLFEEIDDWITDAEIKLKSFDGIYNLINTFSNVKYAYNLINLYSGGQLGAIDKAYSESKQVYNETIEKSKKISEQIQTQIKELDEIYKSKKVFVGFGANHTFRSKDQSGTIFFGHIYYYFDKDLSKIVYQIDLNGEEYKLLSDLETLIETFKSKALK